MAYRTIEPTHTHFWQEVATHVPGRTAGGGYGPIIQPLHTGDACDNMCATAGATVLLRVVWYSDTMFLCDVCPQVMVVLWYCAHS
jgi:hypothetical protein